MNRAMYLSGLRVPSAWVPPGAVLSASAAEGAYVALTRTAGPAPEGWITVPRGYARPPAAEPEELVPLTAAHHPAMRGLYGLFAGRFDGMAAREDPEEWARRLAALPRPLGLFSGDRLLIWLAEAGGDLLELSAAPDALLRIPGALAAAKVRRAPAPLLGVPAEEWDGALKARLLRPIPPACGGIATAEALARALHRAVRWDL